MSSRNLGAKVNPVKGLGAGEVSISPPIAHTPTPGTPPTLRDAGFLFGSRDSDDSLPIALVHKLNDARCRRTPTPTMAYTAAGTGAAHRTGGMGRSPRLSGSGASGMGPGVLLTSVHNGSPELRPTPGADELDSFDRMLKSEQKATEGGTKRSQAERIAAKATADETRRKQTLHDISAAIASVLQNQQQPASSGSTSPSPFNMKSPEPGSDSIARIVSAAAKNEASVVSAHPTPYREVSGLRSLGSSPPHLQPPPPTSAERGGTIDAELNPSPGANGLTSGSNPGGNTAAANTNNTRRIHFDNSAGLPSSFLVNLRQNRPDYVPKPKPSHPSRNSQTGALREENLKKFHRPTSRRIIRSENSAFSEHSTGSKVSAQALH